MRAAMLTGTRRLEVREVPRPEPLPHEVLVRVAAVGLCGTDLHLYAGHGNYNRDERGRIIPFSEHPQILGHEIAGVVAEVGSAVDDLEPGDSVVVDQGRNCVGERRDPACEYCRSGDSHQCEQYGEHGITGLPGGLADFMAMPAANLIRYETELEAAVAALTEPLGCIVHTLDLTLASTARYSLADPGEKRVRTVLICGGGPAGLLFTQYLRNVLSFEGRLIVSEPNPTRRALAERFGAEVLDPSTVDVADAVQELTRGRRVELLIEATGLGPVFADIPRLIRKQATVVLYGHGHSGSDLGLLNQVQFLEPTFVSPIGASGGFEPDGRPTTYLRALRLIEEGLVEIAPMISHRYDMLDAVARALESDYRQPDYVKGVVTL